MLLARSFAVGVFGALLMVVTLQFRHRLGPHRRARRPAVVLSTPSATLIDVASRVSPSGIAALVHLAPGEHVTAVDNHRVTGDLEAGAAIASRGDEPGSYVDLTVSRGTASRRVLVLMH